jgi:hypothetical protein
MSELAKSIATIAKIIFLEGFTSLKVHPAIWLDTCFNIQYEFVKLKNLTNLDPKFFHAHQFKIRRIVKETSQSCCNNLYMANILVLLKATVKKLAAIIDTLYK